MTLQAIVYPGGRKEQVRRQLPHELAHSMEGGTTKMFLHLQKDLCKLCTVYGIDLFKHGRLSGIRPATDERGSPKLPVPTSLSAESK
jgi:hypothetical protein